MVIQLLLRSGLATLEEVVGVTRREATKCKSIDEDFES